MYQKIDSEFKDVDAHLVEDAVCFTKKLSDGSILVRCIAVYYRLLFLMKRDGGVELMNVEGDISEQEASMKTERLARELKQLLA